MLWSLLKGLRSRPAVAAPDGPRRLHIGGQVRKAGWEVLDALPGPAVDHLGNARDLGRFADGSFVELYASHCLEHLDFRSEVAPALREWHRVLAPGGRLYVSVPDLAALAQLILNPALTVGDRRTVVKMLFGAHRDAYDYHQAGFDFALLRDDLEAAGFVAIRRVETFGLFDDYSALVSGGIPISLNVIAERPAAAGAA